MAPPLSPEDEALRLKVRGMVAVIVGDHLRWLPPDFVSPDPSDWFDPPSFLVAVAIEVGRRIPDQPPRAVAGHVAECLSDLCAYMAHTTGCRRYL